MQTTLYTVHYHLINGDWIGRTFEATNRLGALQQFAGFCEREGEIFSKPTTVLVSGIDMPPMAGPGFRGIITLTSHKITHEVKVENTIIGPATKVDILRTTSEEA